MYDFAVSANLIRWQRVSITALLLALFATACYYNLQLHRTRLALGSSRRQTTSWREQAYQVNISLQKEREVTEGLKTCMTFDRTYIRSLESKLAIPKHP